MIFIFYCVTSSKFWIPIWEKLNCEPLSDLYSFIVYFLPLYPNFFLFKSSFLSLSLSLCFVVTRYTLGVGFGGVSL